MRVTFFLVQKEERGIVNKKYILLGNQSTVDQIANPKLLMNIRKANKPITVYCNAGSTITNLKVELGSMTMKHNLYSIAKRHRVTYNRWDRGGVFQVHTPGAVVEFKSSSHGFHYLDITNKGSKVEWMLVNMLQANFEGFTRCKVEKANEVQRLQGMIGNPAKNFPVNVHGINNASCILVLTLLI